MGGMGVKLWGKTGISKDHKEEVRNMKEKARVRIKAIPCEVYSRVVGYFRPVANWNPGKQVEFAERKTVRIDSYRKISCGCGT